MKRIIKPFAIMFSAIVLVASCLSEDNDYDITYYSDTAITSFSLGELNRYLVTKATSQFNEDGTPQDSTYVVTVDGSEYKFYIDQIGRKIYNPDSLPVGTDAAHVICNVGSKNGGVVVIKDIESDTLRFYSNTDSVDFSSPREFMVYSTDTRTRRSYTVNVNVHKEDPDSFRWNAVGTCDGFTMMKGMKAVEFNGKIMVYGSDGNSTSVYTTDAGNGASWEAGTMNIRLDAEAYNSISVHGNVIFTISDGILFVSDDGLTWWDSYMLNNVTDAPLLKQLIGIGRVKLYAIDAGGDILSSDNHGVSWNTDIYGGSKDMLPSEYISLAGLPVATNPDAERIIIAGIRDVEDCPEDSVAMVWNKIEEFLPNSEQHMWIPCDEDNNLRLPRLAGLKMTVYGKKLIAVGGHGLGRSTAQAFSQMYVSEDNGLTWHEGGEYVLPGNFTNGESDVFAMTVDSDNCLWIICGGTGQVWRGRLNRLGWAEYQTSFNK